MSNITTYRHPWYSGHAADWRKWRLVYEGGDCFVDAYLKPFSDREDNADFRSRKCMTPVPAFAKAAVNDIKNSLYSRFCDIARRGGSTGYQSAIQGQDNGVDLHGSSMNGFMGTQVLPELLVMAKVGVYVDMPELPGNNLLASAGTRPYIYMYRAEEICSWTWRPDRPDEFGSVLLCDYVDQCCPDTGLPNGQWARYRHLWIAEDGRVHCKFYNEEGLPVDKTGLVAEDEFILNIDYIPFVVLELNNSLLADVANHQIALLNMESADVAYAVKGNFVFYTEQRDPRLESPHLKPKKPDGTGTNSAQTAAATESIEVGTIQGRAYAPQMDRPGFIAPPSEPLEVSMKKEDQLKEDIRTLVNLSLSNIKSTFASAESKAMDERGLESGLGYIGLVLEHGERKIAKYWAAYEGSGEIATIKYPEKYSLMSDKERDSRIKQMSTVRDAVPSITFRRTVNKEIATVMVGHQVSIEQLDAIHAEIDKAPAFSADPDVIDKAVVGGYLDRELAAELMGYPEGTADKANEEAAERQAQIAESQAGARGVSDMSADPKRDVNAERQQNQENALAEGSGKPERGEGKKPEEDD